METTQWSSLPVPSVQELVKKPQTTVPPRYVRDDLQQPIISNTDSFQVPVIDMQKLLPEDFTDSELEKFHLACKQWGFFQLINHGVTAMLLEKVKLEIEEFFKMPMEEKKRYWQIPGEIEGFGQAFVVSEEQKLDWADMFFMTTLPTHLRRPHLFSKLPLPLRDTLEAYSAELKKLVVKILKLMAKALKMEENDMRELFEEGMQSMRVNYYPPCPQPEHVTGLNPHSDGGGLTILLQINEMEGLQVRKDGVWVPIKPLPNAFVINIGDILEQIVTNGVHRSIEHRAMVNSVKERLSIATFYSPNIDGEMGPAPSLISANTPPLFRRISVADYFKGLFSRKLQGKSNIDVMRIQNQEGINN